MKKTKGLQQQTSLAMVVAFGVIASGDAFAHANVAAKDYYFTTDGRSYIEALAPNLNLI